MSYEILNSFLNDEEKILFRKFDSKSKYFGMSCAKIVMDLFASDVHRHDFFYQMSNFRNQRQGKFWNFYFVDGSILAFENYESETIKIHVFDDAIAFFGHGV